MTMCAGKRASEILPMVLLGDGQGLLRPFPGTQEGEAIRAHEEQRLFHQVHLHQKNSGGAVVVPSEKTHEHHLL